jgi:hypothetical protein
MAILYAAGGGVERGRKGKNVKKNKKYRKGGVKMLAIAGDIC